MKTHKRKKSSRMHGRKMGTHGWGARKKHKKSGHRGGIGMAGSGKRGDQKKTLITKLYGSSYFGKKGVKAKTSEKAKSMVINLGTIQSNLNNFLARGIAKEENKKIEINLSKYKILGNGNFDLSVKIIAKEASKSALEKVSKNKGEIILPKQIVSDKAED